MCGECFSGVDAEGLKEDGEVFVGCPGGGGDEEAGFAGQEWC